MLKVSISAVLRWVNICRLDLDAAALTDESNDSVSALWRVTGWLRSVDALQVSLSVFSCCFIVDALDLGLYKSNFHPVMSPLTFDESNDYMGSFGEVSRWLHGVCTS